MRPRTMILVILAGMTVVFVLAGLAGFSWPP